MNRGIKNVLGITAICALASVAAFFCVLCWTCTRTAQSLTDASTAIAKSVGGVSPAIASLNSATGQWASASAAQAKSVTAIERDVRVEMWQVDNTLKTTNATIAKVGTTVDKVGAVADAAVDDLNTANADLKAVMPMIDEGKQMALAGTSTVNDLDGLLKANATHLSGITANLDGITGNTNLMLVNGVKVTNHYEQIIDNPKKSPIYIRLLPPTLRVAVEAAADYFGARAAQK